MIWVFILAIMASHLLLLELAGGLGLLWACVVHEIFACLTYWWGTASYDYCIYESKLLRQKFWNSVMIYHYQGWCKQYDCATSLKTCSDQKTCSSESNTCFYNWVCKQLFFDLLCLHHPCHCCNVMSTPTHVIDVRTRNRCFSYWNLCLSH